MTKLTIRERGPISGNSQYADALLQAGAISVDQDSYSATPDSTVLDRVYNIKGLDNMHVEIENTGANPLTYKIEKARKEFKLLSTLVDADFNENIKGNTDVLAGVAASGTVTLASVVGRAKASGTITIASPVANTFATGTATLVSVIATDTVTINGLIYLAVSGAASEGEFDIDGDDAANAIELRNAINADTRSGTVGDLTATASTNVVTVTTDVSGTGGNAVTLTSQDATITVSGSGTLTGGVTADIVTVNGLIYTAVAGAKADDTQFSIDGSDTVTATDLADSIDDDTRSGTLNDLTAVGVAAVVTATQTVGGTGGNATTLTSSDGTRLAVSGATFTGGVNGDTVTVNALVYTAVVGVKTDNTEFSIDGSDTVDAADLVDSITNDTRQGTLADVTAANVAGVVTLTSTARGTAGNAVTLVSSDGTRLAVSGATFAGGVDSISINDIVDISPESTAIRIKVRRKTAGQSTTLAGIVSVD